jgi:hypothetical protein
LKKIREAKRRLEERERGRQGGGAGGGEEGYEPDEKAQISFTDPEARIMTCSNKGFAYCYNAQAVVDDGSQIIVAANVTVEANDKRQAVPRVQRRCRTWRRQG